MSDEKQSEYEGLIIRLKNHYGVVDDIELSNKCGYSISSISNWRHNGFGRRTADKLAKITGLDSGFIMNGVSSTNKQVGTTHKAINKCFEWLDVQRRNYCIAYLVHHLKTPSVINIAHFLYELDNRMMAKNNEYVTTFTYDYETKLPLEFVLSILKGNDDFVVYTKNNMPYLSLKDGSELQSVIINETWSTVYIGTELKLIERVLKKYNNEYS